MPHTSPPPSPFFILCFCPCSKHLIPTLTLLTFPLVIFLVNEGVKSRYTSDPFFKDVKTPPTKVITGTHSLPPNILLALVMVDVDTQVCPPAGSACEPRMHSALHSVPSDNASFQASLRASSRLVSRRATHSRTPQPRTTSSCPTRITQHLPTSRYPRVGGPELKAGSIV